MTPLAVSIRPLGEDPEDLAAAARLAQELGYPCHAAELAERLEPLRHSPLHAVLTAESEHATPSGRIVGWMHVEASHALIHEPLAEIVSLVVDSTARGRGVGASLIRAAEAWARSRGLARLRVRCRVEREDAHRFYVRENFTLEKTQKVFSKRI